MNWGLTADWAVTIAAIGAMTAAFLSAWAAFEMNRRTKASNRTAAFAERFQVFKLAQEALELVIHNKPEKFQAYERMREAMHRARFLFPDGFADSLEQMRLDLIDATPLEDVEGGYSDETRAKRNQAIKNVIKHHKELSQLFAPHMRIND